MSEKTNFQKMSELYLSDYFEMNAKARSVEGKHHLPIDRNEQD